MSYLNRLLLDNNYGIVTETLFSYVPKSNDNFVNSSFINVNPSWIVTQLPLQERAFQDIVPEKITKSGPEKRTLGKSKKRSEKKIKKMHKGKDTIKKCFLKLFKKKGKKGKKFGKHKFMLPLILGLVLAKSLLIPIVLKAITLISAKGLVMGFFSTVLASILSLKGLFGSHRYQSRIDDANTRVEIIRLPKDDHYYDDLHSRRDFIPIYKRISYN